MDSIKRHVISDVVLRTGMLCVMLWHYVMAAHRHTIKRLESSFQTRH